MEKELNEAKGRFKFAKKDVKDAKQKSNQVLEEVINVIENKKKEILETQNFWLIILNPDLLLILKTLNKYEEAVVELELRKNKINRL